MPDLARIDGEPTENAAMQEDTRPIDELILVFDADAGALNALVDSTRKLFRLKGCSLCRITHGLAGERSEWASCRDSIGVPVDYRHRDQLDETLAGIVGDQLPCVLARAAGRTELLMGPSVLDRCAGSVPDFRGRLMHHAARLGLEIAS